MAVMHGAPTRRLNNRHLVAAMMYAAGLRQCDIAEMLGYSANRVSILCSSPLFQAQVRELQERLRDSTIADAVTLIEREAAASVRVLVSLRDGSEQDNVRRLSANDLLDRHPRFARKGHDSEAPQIRISFGAAELRQMLTAFPGSPPDAVRLDHAAQPAEGPD